MDKSSVTAVAQMAPNDEAEIDPAIGRRTKVVIVDNTSEAQRLVLERHFTVEARSVVDGKMYSGAFTAKKVTIGGQGRLGVIRARLNEGLQVDETTDYLHRMIAQCHVSLTRAPDWFSDLESFHDIDILTAIFGEVMAFERSFRQVVRK
jgi:hypothetical protein